LFREAVGPFLNARESRSRCTYEKVGSLVEAGDWGLVAEG